MSAVTLETLRADFWEKVARQPKPRDPAANPNVLYAPAAFTLAVWNIAEHHGLQAAMLYKLSDGAIDPRGAA